jgi:hypothetical protein
MICLFMVEKRAANYCDLGEATAHTWSVRAISLRCPKTIEQWLFFEYVGLAREKYPERLRKTGHIAQGEVLFLHRSTASWR